MSLSNKNLMLQKIADLKALIDNLETAVNNDRVNSPFLMPHFFDSEINIHAGRITDSLEALKNHNEVGNAYQFLKSDSSVLIN